MDRRIGDRRADGLPPAPDTPARHDTGKRRRSTDHKASSLPASPAIGAEVSRQAPPHVKYGHAC
jgi:hypothetical protein